MELQPYTQSKRKMMRCWKKDFKASIGIHLSILQTQYEEAEECPTLNSIKSFRTSIMH
jgi:hypothetical protein